MPAAKGRGKTRSWLTKNQHELQEKEIFHERPLHRRRTKNILHRVQSRKNSNVDDLLYKFLGDLTAINNKRRHMKTKHFKVPNARMRRSGRAANKTKKTRAKKGLSTLSFEQSESPSKSIFESTEDNASLSTAMETILSRPSSAYSNTSTFFSEPPVPVDSKQGVKNLLKRNSLIEIIKNYIKVGIEADEERAKNYMKKAITFGVNSGFLKPVDNSGHLLEISSDLPGIKIKVKRDIVEERKRRKNMRRGIVNFDDYHMKPSKKRNSSKLDHEKRQKDSNTITPKKRARSTTRKSESALKVEEKKKEKNPPAKKKAKILRQSRKTEKSTRNTRRRRSPTPWRTRRISPSEEKNNESPTENTEDDHQENNEKKEEHDGNNNLKETIEKRKATSTPSRKEDGKNHMQDSTIRGNVIQNLNLGAEHQEPVESALQEGDKQ